MKNDSEEKAMPFINVTPLIDVLLVLLIIFMVASPLKPARFETKLPSEQKPPPDILPNPTTLIVTIAPDLQLKLNGLENMGSVSDTSKLSSTLLEVFRKREENRLFHYGLEARQDLPESERIERRVFIKAPRSISYGNVAKVIDGVKTAGAKPVGLLLDDLN